MSSSGGSRIAKKMEASISSGDFYSALQMAKSLYARKLAAKRRSDALSLLQDAASTMAAHGQTAATRDLGCILCDHYKEDNLDVTDERRAFIDRLLASMDPHWKDQATLLKQVCLWALKVRGEPDTAFHLLAARAYWRSGDGDGAGRNYLLAHEPEEYAEMLKEWSDMGFASERDLFLARAVMRLLAKGFLDDAKTLREEFLKLLPPEEGRQPPSPLLNFLRFLLMTLERDAAPLFTLLVQRYTPTLERDDALPNLAAEIGRKFYNIEPPKSMIESVMGMFSGVGPRAGAGAGAGTGSGAAAASDAGTVDSDASSDRHLDAAAVAAVAAAAADAGSTLHFESAYSTAHMEEEFD